MSDKSITKKSKDKFEQCNADVLKWIKHTESEAIQAKIKNNIGEDNDLQVNGQNVNGTDLAEDKEIATKAVAFVVNSSRKGIVKLCSEVGSLMKDKQRLEKKVKSLKIQNATLRRSLENNSVTNKLNRSLSETSSPLPQSCHTSSCDTDRSDSGFPLDSRPSSSISTLNDGKKSPARPNNFLNVSKHHQLQTITNTDTDTTTNNNVIIHTNNNNNNNSSANLPQKKHNLPKIVTSPIQTALKISPQPPPPPPLHQVDDDRPVDGVDIIDENADLKRKLHLANLEIGRLNKKMLNVEKLSRRRQLSEQSCGGGGGELVVYEDECTPPSCCNSPRTLSDLDSPRSDCSSGGGVVGCKNNFKRMLSTTSSTTSATGGTAPSSTTTYPLRQTGALKTCICNGCVTVQNEFKLNTVQGTKDKDVVAKCPLKDGPIALNARVLLKDQRSGTVKYVGHLQEAGEPNLIFIGVELSKCSGKNDGTFKAKRYFQCKPGYGLFVSVNDIERELQLERKTSLEFNYLDPSETCNDDHHQQMNDKYISDESVINPFKNPNRKGYSLPLESKAIDKQEKIKSIKPSSLRLCHSDGLTRCKSPVVPDMHIIDMDMR